MAKILTGGGVSAIRGSIAGQTFSVNANGAYVRNRGTISNRNTPLQQVARAILASVAMAWRSLTDSQRLTWITLAMEYTYTDSLGISSKLTGFQLFQKFNQSLQQVGRSMITVAPTLVTLETIEFSAGNIDISAQTLGLTATFLPSESVNVPTGCVMLVEATNEVSAGVYRPKRPQFRQITILNEGEDVTAGFSIANYTTVFGSMPAVGGNVFVRLTLVSKTSGERTSPVFSPVSVTA